MNQDLQDKSIRKWVAEYRKRGYQPLPSDPTHKKPLMRFGEYWTTRIPETPDPFDMFAHKHPNIQCMTGCHWGLVVVDIDGEDAADAWLRLLGMGRYHRKTWEVRTGSGGKHIWFSYCPLDARIESVPSRRLWGLWEPEANEGRGGWRKHCGIELLCDHKLVMVPPSIHPRTGRRYKWIHGHSPFDIARPVIAPFWLLNMPACQPPRATIPFVAPPKLARMSQDAHYRYGEVLDAITDKIALARSWGLRIVSERPNQSGWCPCRALDREDRNPSASFSPRSGRYWDNETGPSGIGFFDLAVRLGIYGSRQEAVNDLGLRYLRRAALGTV